MKIVLVLDNIRSAYNVGAILRTAEGFGVEKVILSGYTPRYDDFTILPHLREKQNRMIHKTALGAEEMLEIESCGDIGALVTEMREQGWQIVGLENNIPEKTVLLGSAEFSTRLLDRVVLILGEEVHGIAPELHELIDVFVEIPMRGRKESFNVSVAAGIALFGITEAKEDEKCPS